MPNLREVFCEENLVERLRSVSSVEEVAEVSLLMYRS